MEINGKIYRNLEGQVEYLTGKWDDLQDQINDVRAHLTHYVIVDALPVDPEDIDTSAVYLVGPLGTAPDTYYEEWVYVQKADESWMWEKLGDTASVDLSGYLPIQTGATTEKQVYTKNTDGTQTMTDVAQSVVAGAIPLRGSSGQILVPTGTPSSDSAATSKGYVVSNFVAQDKSTTPYAKAYIKNADGTQDTTSMTSSDPTQGFIAQWGAGGRMATKDPVNSSDAVNKSYADSNYVAKLTTTTTYPQAYYKRVDGTQDTYNMSYNAVDGTIMLRSANGQVMLPNQTQYVPTDDQAVSKRYVDAVVGQLLYLHDINLIINVDATNKLYVKAYLINDDPTAITTFDRILYKRIDIQWGAFGAHSYDAEAAAVTKLPNGFRQDDFEEPLVGFLYQYFSGGNLVSGATNSIMSTTITDTVINF